MNIINAITSFFYRAPKCEIVPYDGHTNCGEPAEVVPGLYIGALDDALSDWPRKNAIDVIINISDVCYAARVGGKLGGANVVEIAMQDKPVEPYDKYEYQYKFQEAARAIESALRSNKRVLVHCIMGINRSATAIMYYLMRCGKSYEEALALLAAANRKRGSPLLTNVSFRELLMDI